jgi:hypothetical protein
MSKFAELLASRGVLTPANPASPANQRNEISSISNISSPRLGKLIFSSDLGHRIRAMARRWQYTDAELSDVLDRARRDPADWSRAVALDEQREKEFCERGWLPKADA